MDTMMDIEESTGPKQWRLGSEHIKRDGLISRMLQDRSTLRFISAPHGFGKTALACEYAVRLFPDDRVTWVDASSPDFLLGLDEGGRDALGDNVGEGALIVLDGLPWLHEQRANMLSHCIDTALYAGAEVVATALPSCDCLSALQPDRLLIAAGDLLVTEQECVPAQIAEADGVAIARKRWRDAGARLFGRVPAVMWGSDPHAQSEALISLFGENLPLSLLRSMFAMLLLQTGNAKDLEAAAAPLCGEDLALLMQSYPLFALDAVSGEFKVAQFGIADLKRAILSNKLESHVLEGTLPLLERVIAMLFRRGSFERGAEVIGAFCDDERCACWLIEQGWDFLDSGQIGLAAKLLDRCPEALYVQSIELRALYAWIAGLSGNRHEACHVAQRVLEKMEDCGGAVEAAVASRIALALFDVNAIAMTRKYRLSSDMAPQDATEFLACVLDSCTNIEIARAFHLADALGNVRLEKSRRAPGRQRARQLSALFTEHADRYRDSRAFRLALHLLAHVDDSGLRRLLRDLGCDAVVIMRKRGVSTFSEAALVRDMWNTGYFGLVGNVVDRRDARVLGGASSMLEQLANCCGKEPVQQPWDEQAIRKADRAKRMKPTVLTTDVEEVHVRLFGGFEVTIGDRYLGEGKWRKRARALFSLLVLAQGRDIPRDDIFAQIWPAMPRANALDNFYTAWSNCASMIGESPYLERNGEYCRIDPRFVHSDVAEFEQLTRRLLTADRDSGRLLDTYAKIEALYRGDLLPSETGVKLINAQRDRSRALYVDAMVAATECALDAGDVRIALWFARKAMEEDQGREDVYQALMKAQIASGQRCPAIKTYLVCREYLQNALGLDPSLETRELYNSLITVDPELLRLEAALSSNAAVHGVMQ